jgi:hypothetical protein
MTAVAGLFVAGTASADINGSAHDLQTEIASLDDICTICHAPHANQNLDGELLWNRADSANEGSYTVYDSPSMEAPGGQPGPVSTLCLSCHDGDVAVDSFGGVNGTATLASFTRANASGQTAFGASLGNDHPIGMTYDTGDAELQLTTNAITFNDGASTGGTVADLLFTNVVECASCHDVHNTQSAGGALGDGLLRVANDANSALCTSCHNK